MGDYTTSELKAIAELLGGEGQAATRQAEVDYQAPEFKRELSRISGRAFSHIRDPKERQALLSQVLDAGSQGDMDTVMALVDQYAPASRGEFDGLLGGGVLNFLDRATSPGPIRGGIEQVADQVVGRTPRDRTRSTDIDSILSDLAELQLDQQRRLRTIDADRYLFNQDAYADITGDPLLAAAVFPQDFSPAQSAMDDEADRANFINTGLYGSQYNQWLDEQEDRARNDDEAVLFDIATGAGTSDTVVDKVIGRLAADPTEVYNLLTTPEAAAVTTGALEMAAEAYEDGMSGSEIKREVTAVVEEKAEEAGLGDYGEVLAAIVREQYDAIYG